LGSYIKSPDGQTKPMNERQHQSIHETAIDLGRYGHQSEFKEYSP
jgi:hypothetical protein